jgi:hypothetical protein
MRRRSFLQKTVLGAAAFTLPTWLGCAFGNKSEWAFDDQDFKAGNSVGKAYFRAQKLGKPLLVWVVPPYPCSREQLNSLSQDQQRRYWDVATERNHRGHAFGELLNYGSEEQRWPLSLCEVVCALPEEIEALTGSALGTPLMVLLETDANQPSARSLEKELPAIQYTSIVVITAETEVPQKSEDEIVEERIAILAELIKEALVPDSKTLTRRAVQARATLPKEQEPLKKIKTKGFTLLQADAIAALVAEVATKSKEPKLFSLLAQAVYARLCKPPIEGSRWGRASGCGTTYETPPKTKANADGTEAEPYLIVITGCGMGHVPEKSVRFLDFYTEEYT